jgi:hypothetical protein
VQHCSCPFAVHSRPFLVVRERLAATSSVVRKPVDDHRMNALGGLVYSRRRLRFGRALNGVRCRCMSIDDGDDPKARQENFSKWKCGIRKAERLRRR